MVHRWLYGPRRMSKCLVIRIVHWRVESLGGDNRVEKVEFQKRTSLPANILYFIVMLFALSLSPSRAQPLTVLIHRSVSQEPPSVFLSLLNYLIHDAYLSLRASRSDSNRQRISSSRTIARHQPTDSPSSQNSYFFLQISEE